MSGTPADPSPENRATEKKADPFSDISGLILFPLILLSWVGIAITDFSPDGNFWYWQIMIPLFAAACIAVERAGVSDRGAGFTPTLIRQLCRWGGLLVALYLVLPILHTGHVPGKTAGSIVILMVALTVFQAGTESGWGFGVTGVFLALSALSVAFVGPFAWVMLIVALIIFTGVLLILRVWLTRSVRRRDAADYDDPLPDSPAPEV